MKYKIAICDDMEQDAQYITSAVMKWAQKENYSVDIQAFSSAESFLFQYAILPISIAENIAVCEESQINTSKLEHVIKLSGLEEKVNTLQEGVRTPLIKSINANGTDLSGGEKQKLLFARALYKRCV